MLINLKIQQQKLPQLNTRKEIDLEKKKKENGCLLTVG